MNKIITTKDLEKFENNYNKKSFLSIGRNAILKVGVNDASLNQNALIAAKNTFSIDISTGSITNQKKSGLCWMFAGLNLLRPSLLKKLNVEDFSFSEQYLLFYDKLERANLFLENILKTRSKKIFDRTVEFILQLSQEDGGYWNYFVGLVEKYGLVPYDVMPDTFHRENTVQLNHLFSIKLREYAANLRFLSKSKSLSFLKSKKEQFMKEIYILLVQFLGKPPLKFDFEYVDKDKKFHSKRNITPLNFYQDCIPLNLKDFFVLINAPLKSKPFFTQYSIDYAHNIVENKFESFVNIPLSDFKSLVINQLKDKIPVWFACGVGEMSNYSKGVFDSQLYNFDKTLGVSFKHTKNLFLEYGPSILTHGMTFQGVNIVRNKPTRWKVENSWGDEHGKKGIFVMSDTWFSDFVVEIVIHKKYLPKKILASFKKKPVVLPFYDFVAKSLFVH